MTLESEHHARKYELPRNLTANFEETTLYLIKNYSSKEAQQKAEEEKKGLNHSESFSGLIRNPGYKANSPNKLITTLSRKITGGIEEKLRRTNFMINPCSFTKHSSFATSLCFEIENMVKSDEREFHIRLLLNYVHRTLRYLSQCEIDITNQHHFVYLLQVLLCISENEDAIEIKDVKGMFYCDNSITTLLGLIIQNFNFSHSSTQVKSICYQLLTRAIELDKTEARNSIKRWFDNQINCINFFSKFFNMIKMVSMTLLSEEISDQYDINYELTDLDELKEWLKFLTKLCVDSIEWQNYLRMQNNCVLNHNILPAITDLLRIVRSRFQFVYAIDTALIILDFIRASVNGHVEQNEKCYVSSRIFDTIQEILQLGFYDKHNTYRDLECKIIGHDMLEQFQLALEDNMKINALKEKTLQVVISLINDKTKHQFSNAKNYDLLMRIIKLSYIQFLVSKNKRMTSDMFSSNTKITKDLSVKVPFLSYYLIAQLWADSLFRESNIVQLVDDETFVSRYFRWFINILYIFYCCKDKSPLINEEQYIKYSRDKKLRAKALRLFEAYSSHIEIVMSDGHSETRYFEILPAFKSFSQTEKNQFWFNANLDTSKSTIMSFVEYSRDKIDEIFIQQKVQDFPLVFVDWAKKTSWMTDVTQTLIVVLNLIIFFSYEVDESSGHRFDDPSIFGFSSGATLGIMYTIGAILCFSLTYLTVIQLTIMIMLQVQRTKMRLWRRNKQMSKSKFKAWGQVLLYMARNLEQTISTRDIWCLIPCTIFAWIAITGRIYMFAFTLIFIVIFFQQILDITKAVWQPWKRIFFTIVLSWAMLYWFALIAYISFHSDFDQMVNESSQSISRLFVVIFDVWHKTEALGGYFLGTVPAISNSEGNYEADTSRIIYDFMFFFIVPTLLVSILSGIIIDNFVERRSKVDAIKNRQNDLCFVCGTPSNEISDFKYHCRYLHNIWDYMYYMGYLRSKHPSEIIDHRDVHAMNLMTNGSLEWFPCYKTLVTERIRSSSSVDGKISTNSSTNLASFESTFKAFTKSTTEVIKSALSHSEDRASSSSKQLSVQISTLTDALTSMEDRFNLKLSTMKSEIAESIMAQIQGQTR